MFSLFWDLDLNRRGPIMYQVVPTLNRRIWNHKVYFFRNRKMAFPNRIANDFDCSKRNNKT
jgi:hypothetical protein